VAIDYGPPDPPFQGELNLVAVDAARADTALAEANRLPDDFPVETLNELCRALAGLKDGTGRNAGVQLEIARAMLPRIRREHFFPEDQVDPSDEDDVRLVRGMSLDQCIGSLITR
jgi:hypothetical protein